MPDIPCQYPECTFVARNDSEAIALVMFNSHLLGHQSPSPAMQQESATKQKLPPIARPIIKQDIDDEEWATFIEEWTRFKRCTSIPAGSLADQLFQCCERALGRLVIKENPNIIEEGEEALLLAIKQMAVIQIATSVRRNNLLQTKQDSGESFREFYANVKAVAATCAFQINCCHACCAEKKSIDYTHLVVKDILVAGVADSEIRKDLLGWSELDIKNDKDVVKFVEEKEMALKAWSGSSTTGSNVGGLSGYRKNKKSENDPSKKSLLNLKGTCSKCSTQISLYAEYSNGKLNKNPFKLCQPCFKASKSKNKGDSEQKQPTQSESSAVSSFIGAIEAVSENSEVLSVKARERCVILDHHIFTEDGWKKVLNFKHPKLRLTISTDADAYKAFKIEPPKSCESLEEVVADSGAQSCLWTRKDYLKLGLKMDDLIPVRHTMNAANSASITIDGAVLLKLEGRCPNGRKVSASVMTYISPEARSFYLSEEALKQLEVLPKDFPQLGGASLSHEVGGISNRDEIAKCGCLKRRPPPPKPSKLPFPCTKENVESMKKWLLQRYASSAFNKCPHQVLPEMVGPPIRIHVDPDAKPVCLRTPAPVPLHWQEQVKNELLRDVELGVLERVPHGEPTKWCFRMVISRKQDGGPRRTVDLSPLNKFCVREAHSSKSPFNLARSVPTGSVKTVCDIWNGYHSVPLQEEDRHLTTFVTPWGLFRYRRAPQGFVSSGDGFNRRFDDLAAHIIRMERCVDDSLLHDIDLEAHWWRTIELLNLVAESGMICNPEKFQFSQPTVDFAGFRITYDSVEPLPKYLDAIGSFPVPKSTTDIRSWFGLVNQVSHYAKLSDCLLPFRRFLSPKVKFEWDEELADAFEKSKLHIVEAIKEGVKIFDITRKTCLTTDWCKTGLGYLLTQKHCQCESKKRGCCKKGWPITLAGSRFCNDSEAGYAPIEGEALAVAWSLEQTRFFTMGCNDLLINTDHEPLVAVLGDKRLDEILNPRLIRLKRRTLLWKFQIQYKPGDQIKFADATSRHPVNSNAALASLNLQTPADHEETAFIASLKRQSEDFEVLSWETLQSHSLEDEQTFLLMTYIQKGFPVSKDNLPPILEKFWPIRGNLNVQDGVALYMDRVIVPQALRGQVLEHLHSAHQGVAGMLSRAQSTLYWPGMSVDIEDKRKQCSICHRNAPSQAKLPPQSSRTPTYPFELIFGDYFKLNGKFFLIIGDRLSGWTEIISIKPSTDTAGSKGLCDALRRVFQTFGVPDELSSDGGPEFISGEAVAFYNKWGVAHRLSSAYLAQSNGRAEVAVKATKRLLESNINSDGSINNDSIVRALLQMRNTPDRDCRLSPAEVLFGRPLRDALPYLDKSKMVFENNQVHSHWHEAWKAKEEAIRKRLVSSSEKLEEHTKELEPLSHGDLVFIQNQDASSKDFKKWNRQGTIITAGKHDQYLVKVHGTGRLTVRNRRFLRKYTLRSPFVEAGPYNPKISSKDLLKQAPAQIKRVSFNVVDQPSKGKSPSVEAPHEVECSDLQEHDNLSQSKGYTGEEQGTPMERENTAEPHNTTPTMVKGSSTPVIAPSTPREDPEEKPDLRRSTRIRKPTKLYDPSSGSYKNAEASY